MRYNLRFENTSEIEKRALAALVKTIHGKKERNDRKIDQSVFSLWERAVQQIRHIAEIVSITVTGIVIESTQNLFNILGKIQDIIRSVSWRIKVAANGKPLQI